MGEEASVVGNLSSWLGVAKGIDKLEPRGVETKREVDEALAAGVKAG